jgi:hypothetical protein
MPMRSCERPLAFGLLVLATASFASGVAAQSNGNEPSDSLQNVLSRADSARARLVQPPGEYGGIRTMDVIRAPFQLFGATLALGLSGVGAGYYFLDKTVLSAGRQVRDVLSEADVEVEYGLIGTRSWPALVLRYEGLSPLFAEVGYSLRQYQHYSAGVRHENAAIFLEAAGTFRRMREPHFWGIGPDAREEDRSDFAQDLTDLRGYAAWRAAPGISLSAEAGWERSETLRGWDGSYPDVQDVFGREALFGLDQAVQFLRIGGGIELDETRVEENQVFGVGATAQLHHYQGVSGTSSRFERAAGSARLFVPVNDRALIALRLLAEDHFGEHGDGVPFTHLARLGDEHGLRGYSGRRFRDLAMAAAQLEWRYETYWHPGFSNLRMDGFVFLDAGNVGPSLSSIHLSDVHVTPGFGLRFLEDGRSRGEVYFGFGGDYARVGFQLGSTF